MNVAADEPPTSICTVTPATVGASPPAGSTIAASFACSWNFGLDVARSFVPTTGVSATDVTVVSPLTGSIVTKSCATVMTSSPATSAWNADAAGDFDPRTEALWYAGGGA